MATSNDKEARARRTCTVELNFEGDLAARTGGLLLGDHDPESIAMLLIDIDHLKMIVAMRGRSAADAVVVCTAEAIRQSGHDGDICARLGEGEFMVFSTIAVRTARKKRQSASSIECDNKRCRSPELSPPCRSGSPHMERTPIFPGCTSDADEALYQARLEGKSCIGVFTPGTLLALSGHRY